MKTAINAVVALSTIFLLFAFVAFLSPARATGFKDIKFWIKYPTLEDLDYGAQGFRSRNQQADLTRWFCSKTTEPYSSVATCEQTNMDAFTWADKKFDTIASLPERDETIGYSCMTEAVDANCYKVAGFCHWTELRTQYNRCVQTSEAE